MESQDSKKAPEKFPTTTPHVRARMALPGAAGRGKALKGRWAGAEGATLVCAVAAAVALGVACGVWINARLASAAPAIRPAPARLRPAADAAERKTEEAPAATEPRPVEADKTTPAAVETAPAHVAVEPPGAEPRRTNPAVTSGASDAAGRGAAGVHPLTSAAMVRPASAAARRVGEPDVKKTDVKKARAAGQGGAAPCTHYTSADSLNVRSGGAATLVVGGPGAGGRVAVGTPDWSDIAVFTEGRAGGNGWLRYSVRSVSQRAGVYSVRVTTPCGSQVIPVTVGRP